VALQLLDLRNNQLTALPDTVWYLLALQELDLRNNPLTTHWTGEVVAMQLVFHTTI